MASENEVIKTKLKHARVHPKAGSVSGAHELAEKTYLHEVVQAVAEAKEILVVGVEAVDHPSDGQLLAYAKKYFLKVDNLKGDTVINP